MDQSYIISPCSKLTEQVLWFADIEPLIYTCAGEQHALSMLIMSVKCQPEKNFPHLRPHKSHNFPCTRLSPHSRTRRKSFIATPQGGATCNLLTNCSTNSWLLSSEISLDSSTNYLFFVFSKAWLFSFFLFLSS